ncbi:MAG: RNA polymerase subunit sigma, partial [Clostridia bacterium]|nr:RNA polymerase subunit sigma [Clostridia bacterium]
VVLHYLEGFSVEETAAILRVGVSAVKMRLSRAREQLRKEENDV